MDFLDVSPLHLMISSELPLLPLLPLHDTSNDDEQGNQLAPNNQRARDVCVLSLWCMFFFSGFIILY